MGHLPGRYTAAVSEAGRRENKVVKIIVAIIITSIVTISSTIIVI